MTKYSEVEYTLEDLLAESGSPITAIGLGADGVLSITGDVSRHIRIYRNSELSDTLNLLSKSDKVRPSERMRSIVVAPSSRRFFVSSGDQLRCFNDEGEEVWSYQPPRAFGFLVTSPLGLALNSSGDLAACFDNGSIGLWNADGDRIALWKDNDAPRWLGFLSDGIRVAGSDGFSACVWDTSIRAKVSKFTPDERIYGFACDSGRDLIAIRTLTQVLIYNANDGALITALPSGEGLPLVTFLPGQHAIATGERTRIRVQLLAGGASGEIDLHGKIATSLASAADGSLLAVGCSDGSLVMHDTGLASPAPPCDPVIG